MQNVAICLARKNAVVAAIAYARLCASAFSRCGQSECQERVLSSQASVA